MTAPANLLTAAIATPPEAGPTGAELVSLAERNPLGETQAAACSEDLENISLAAEAAEASGSNPDLWLYRDRTVGILRRYLRHSVEVGRLPSLLGREFFRARVTSYRASTFEDAVIFVHDVERSLEKLDEFDKLLIAKIVLQEYSQEEAAGLLGCGHRTVRRHYPEALDRVSEILLERGILTRLPATKAEPAETCQEGKSEQFAVSASEETKYIF